MATIEPFRPEDIPAVLDLWRRSPGVGLSSSDTPERVAAFLAHNPGTSFVARAGGEIVGAVLGGSDGRRGYLNHLAVDPGHQRQGVGRALVGAVVEAWKSLGILKAHLFVETSNQDVMPFYERLGWYRRRDLVMMSMDLPPDADG